VLRSYLRERTGTEQLIEELQRSNPALGYSHPEWLFQRWAARWGTDRAVELMRTNNRPARPFARVNTLRTEAKELLELWKEENVSASPVQLDWVPDQLMFELNAHRPLTELPSFQRGMFYVQDPSTLLAVQMLDPQPTERVLDLCAAPGGKTTYIAQCKKNLGQVMAEEVQPDRLKMVNENCARLGVSCVTTRAAAPASAAAEQFTRILLDAPCSNTGVMRRRVDLRWRIRTEEITRLQRTQRGLLSEAADRLKPGGTLVYSTCSLEPEENRQVVEQFLGAHANFKLESERELLPSGDGSDGAYVARLQKG
jgi:16S rRNA (cytosine967-C5)-methyltransferase